MLLKLSAFMSHDSSEIELPSHGVTLVTGANGSGKSAIAEAIAQCMWGRSLRGTRWSPWRDVKGNVEITDGSLRVQRRWTGKSKALTFTREADAEHDTTTKAQEDLDSIVGTFEAWKRTRIFSSADAAHFTLASDAERKELLEQLLGLGWFERALDACRSDLRTALAAVQAAETARTGAASRADGLRSGLTDAHRLLVETPVPVEIGAARAEARRVEEMRAASARELATLQERISALRSTGGADDERARQARVRMARIAEDECPTCHQIIPASLRDALAVDERRAVEAAEAARAAVAAELRSLMDEARELATERDDLSSLAGKRKAEINAVEHQRTQREKLERAVESNRDQITEALARVNEAQAKLDTLSIEVAELRACEQVLGVRGARAKLLGDTLGAVEGAANAWLSRMGSTITVGLKPYTERKSGSVVDSISLSLTGAGGDGGYVGASAGERRRVDVALLLALAATAAGGQSSASWQSPIFFDEVFDSLDTDGRAAVAELVTDLSKTASVVVISHDESVQSGVHAVQRLRVDSGLVTCE